MIECYWPGEPNELKNLNRISDPTWGLIFVSFWYLHQSINLITHLWPPNTKQYHFKHLCEYWNHFLSKCVILCLFCGHSVSFCVKLCQTFHDFVEMYLVVQGKPIGDIITNFPNFKGPDCNLQLKNISKYASLIKLDQILAFIANFARLCLYVSNMIEC